MMPVVMHFATFMKLLTQDTGDKLRDLEKYGQPGGFDFWRPLRDGLVAHVAHRRERERVVGDIEAVAAQNAKARNVEVFERVADWVARQSGHGFVPNRGVWRSPGGAFSVHIEPEIGLENRSGRQLVAAVYGRREPRIRRDQAGAAIILLQRAYRANGNEEFGVFDAGAPRLMRSTTNVSEQLLDAEIDFIDTQLSRILGP